MQLDFIETSRLIWNSAIQIWNKILSLTIHSIGDWELLWRAPMVGDGGPNCPNPVLVHHIFLAFVYSISFFALKNLRRYSTCHVANPSKQHMLNMLKNNTRLVVDSVTIENEKFRSETNEIQQVDGIDFVSLTVCAAHFLFTFAHSGKVLYNRVRQIFQTLEIHFQWFQFTSLANLLIHNK